MKRAFTLIELLVIVAIMGVMVTVGIASVRSGQGAARLKGATRDIFATIRQARSTALVTQQPAVITYSTEEVDGEVVARVKVTATKLMTEGVDPSKVRTIAGRPLKSAMAAQRAEKGGDDKSEKDDSEGDTLKDVLFMPMDDNIVKGMRIKVVVGGGGLDGQQEEHRTKISVFSNVDYLLRRFNESNKSEEPPAKAEPQEENTAAAKDERQEPVSVVWDTNGRPRDPHQVWIYADGKDPESGLSIKIDRFGAAKVLPGDGREEDD